MRIFLTTWSAIAAMAICPFFCMGDAPGDSSCTEEFSRQTCCSHCCRFDAPARDEDGAPELPCCEADCLCKGALPVKLPVEWPPPSATDMLPMESHGVALNGAPGETLKSP